MLPALLLLLICAPAETADEAPTPATPTAAPNPSVQQRIDNAHTALMNLEYETAADDFMIAATDSRATLDERLEANLYAGIANRVLGRDVDARLNFTFVLKHRPTQQLPPNTPPKISAFFELVRQEIEMNEPAAPEPPPPTTSSPPAAAPVAPAPPPDEGGIGWKVIGGSTLAAVGVLAVLLSGSLVALSEFALGQATLPGEIKTLSQVGGWTAAGFTVAGAVVVVAGASLVTWGALE